VQSISTPEGRWRWSAPDEHGWSVLGERQHQGGL